MPPAAAQAARFPPAGCRPATARARRRRDRVRPSPKRMSDGPAAGVADEVSILCSRLPARSSTLDPMPLRLLTRAGQPDAKRRSRGCRRRFATRARARTRAGRRRRCRRRHRDRRSRCGRRDRPRCVNAGWQRACGDVNPRGADISPQPRRRRGRHHEQIERRRRCRSRRTARTWRRSCPPAHRRRQTAPTLC